MSLPWPLIFAYDKAADTLQSTMIGGQKMLVAFEDESTLRHWKGNASPFVATDPTEVLPVLRLMLSAGGNDKLAVMYPDPPDKWRVVHFDLAAVIKQLEIAAEA